MRIFICDDDALFIEQLQSEVCRFFDSFSLLPPEIRTFTDGAALLADPQPCDLIFLDIEMPGLDGISVGQKCKHRDPEVSIIVISSYPEYLDEAMRFHVFRYLSKPLDRQRLFRNLKDFLNDYHSRIQNIPVETKGGVQMLPVSKIILIEAVNRKVLIHTNDGDLESLHNMAYWLKQLPDSQFFQSHRSFIVNFAHVSSFDHTLIYLTKDNIPAYLTRRKYHEFKNAYLNYLESMR